MTEIGQADIDIPFFKMQPRLHAKGNGGPKMLTMMQPPVRRVLLPPVVCNVIQGAVLLQMKMT
jgi:hypothetical protein